MSDQRSDDETLGRALGRAVESQSVRETPFSASRLASRLDRPARGGWLGTLAVAAALGLFVAMGAFFAGRGPQGVATPDASATPAVSATSGPSVQPTAIPASCDQLTRVFFARDQLPPVAGMVRGTCGGGAGVLNEIGHLMTALLGARPEDVPPGAFNATGRTPSGGRPNMTSTSVQVDGDLATVEIGVDPAWAARGAAQSQALVQQLIYTITEAPGIRRVQLKDPRKQAFTIDQLTVDKPLSREDVFGYALMAPADQRIESNGTVVAATLTSKIDDVQTGGPGQPVRLVIDVAPQQTVQGGSWMPAFTATMRPTAGSSAAKYEIEITVQGGGETTLRDQAIDVTPLRYVRVTGDSAGTTYRLGVDDARPWRVSTQPGAGGGMRIHVDVGGHPAMVNRNIAIYSPIVGQTVTGSITIAGAARVYEANVSWRLRDANGREVSRGFTTATNGSGPVWGSFQTTVPVPAGLSGRATLEVLWGSPRDGTDQDVVSIPLQVR